MLPLLLASSSVYRRELLSRLHLPFICTNALRQPAITLSRRNHCGWLLWSNTLPSGSRPT